MVDVLGAAVGVLLGLAALVGVIWKYVVLPNLREQLGLIRETHKQVTENGHSNAAPTVLDRIDDVAHAQRSTDATVSLLALNLNAVMQQLANHTGESTEDRRRLWLIVETLIHEDHERRTQRDTP